MNEGLGRHTMPPPYNALNIVLAGQILGNE